MKKLSLIASLALAATLVSCGNGGSAPAPAQAKLENLFVSEQKLTYANNRPKYNYYETTFTFQSLELYSDSTYKLTVSSCTFSALILPEEGNAANGNARGKSLLSYYGSYSATKQELDDNGLDITFSSFTRFAGFRLGSQTESNGIIDTDNWNDQMKKEWADVVYEYDENYNKTEKSRTEYSTGAEWLAAHQVTIKGTSASKENGMMDWVVIEKK